MKAQDVIKQLAAKLPLVTGAFSSTLDCTLTFSGGVVVGTTTTPHGLDSGDVVTVSGAVSPNQIISLTQVDNIATAVTLDAHDLTEGYQETVEITGAMRPEYNGNLPLLTVPNRKTFTYQISGDPLSPDPGAPYLWEERLGSYNGRHSLSVIDSTTFAYPIAFSPGSPAAGSPTLHKSLRISGAATIERALDAYTAQATGNYWAFVVVGDVNLSRDRAILSDADINYTGPEHIRAREIENFSVFVFIPCTDEIAGRDARDTVDDITVSLYKSLAGARLPSPLAGERASIVMPVGNRLFADQTAFLVHEFMFQTVRDITIDDIVSISDNVAFRDIDFRVNNESNEIIMQTLIDLDEVPL